MREFRFLVFLVVLGTFIGSATATAQTVMTAGQIEALVAFQSCGKICEYGEVSDDASPAFFVTPRFGVVVDAEQSRRISASFGSSGTLYLRRHVGEDVVYYEPNIAILADEDRFSKGTEILYTYLYVWQPGIRAAERQDVGFVRTFVGYIPDDATVPYSVDGFSAAPGPETLCDGCISETVPGWYYVTLTGNLPEAFHATPTSTDGNLLSLHGEQSLVENGKLRFARFTNTRASVSLTLHLPNGEFMSLPNLFMFGKGYATSPRGGRPR